MPIDANVPALQQYAIFAEIFGLIPQAYFCV